MHNPVNIPGFRVIVILSNLLVLAFFLYSGWTVVGLFRMRPWARVAGIVIGALVFFFSLGSCIGVLAVRNLVPSMPPPPAGEPASVLSMLPLIVMGVAVLYGLAALIGLWWGVYFSLPKVRAVFTGAGLMVTNPEIVPHGGSVTIAPEAAGTSGWRVVILVYAGLMLLGILGLPMVLLMHLPLFFFGAVVSGGVASAILVVMVALQIALGIGLIRKWKFAWYLAVAWLLYGVVYTLAFLVPGMRDKFIAYQEGLTARWSTPGFPQVTASIYHGPFAVICFGLGIVLFVLFAVALFRCKDDYLSA